MKVLITGGTGFLGTALGHTLWREKYNDVFRAGKKDGDLRNLDQAMDLFGRAKPEVVFHLGASVAGIGGNRRTPATLWRDNLLMGIHVLDACVAHHVRKLVLVGTTCSYPKTPPRIPFQEEDLFSGYPEDTNAPYGIAKLAVMVGAAAYAKQFGIHAVTVIPTNLYGPGDNFDPNTSHVIPAIVRKIWHAMPTGSDEARMTGVHQDVTLWGSGAATRDFLFVRDAALALVRVMERYDDEKPVNIGSGREVSIRQLAAMIGSAMKYTGNFKWNTEMPDGQPRRCLSTARATEVLGWQSTTELADGLVETVDWFAQNPA